MQGSAIRTLLCAALLAALVRMSAAQFSECSLLRIDDPASCRDTCISVYTTPSYTYVNRAGDKKCSCTVGSGTFPVCGVTTTTTTTTNNITTSTTSPEPTTTTHLLAGSQTPEDVVKYMTGLVGMDCEKTLEKAFDEDAIACFNSLLETGFSRNDSEPFVDYYDRVCDDDCLLTIFGAEDDLTAAGCLPNGTDPMAETLDNVAFLQRKLSLECTQPDGGDGYCGELLPLLNEYENTPDEFNATDCTTVVSYGNCLGNIIAEGMAMPMLLQPHVTGNVAVLRNDMHTYCTSVNVTGVLSASQATEALASLSGSMATSVVGAVFAAVLLALFA